MRRKPNVVDQRSKIDALYTLFGFDPDFSSESRARELEFLNKNFRVGNVHISEEEVTQLLVEVSQQGIFLTFLDDEDESKIQKLVQLVFQPGVLNRLDEAERACMKPMADFFKS